MSPCKPLPSGILSMNLYMSWVLSKLLELQCNWKIQNHRQGLKKKLYTIYNLSPPKKNYLCIITFLNAWGLVTGTVVLPDEKCLSFIVSGPIFRIFLLRPHAKTERKLNVSLADLIRCCPFTQGHSVVFRFIGSLYFMVCKDRYTHSLIIPQYSVGSSAVKKAKCDGSLFKFFVEQFGNPSNTSK